MRCRPWSSSWREEVVEELAGGVPRAALRHARRPGRVGRPRRLGRAGHVGQVDAELVLEPLAQLLLDCGVPDAVAALVLAGAARVALAARRAARITLARLGAAGRLGLRLGARALARRGELGARGRRIGSGDAGLVGAEDGRAVLVEARIDGHPRLERLQVLVV